MKHLIRLLIISLMIAANPAWADSTISGLPPGGMIQPTDSVPVSRCTYEGCDYKVNVGSLAPLNYSSDFVSSNGSLLLDSVNENEGTFGSTTSVGQFTVDEKGRITSAANVSIPSGSNTSQGLLKCDGATTTCSSGVISAIVSGMVYPAAGVPISLGTSWGTSLSIGTAANNLVQLNSSGQLPALSAANLTNFPTLNQSTTGNAATATALATTPTGCLGGQFSTGIAANGNANCSTPSATGTTPVTTIATSGSSQALVFPPSGNTAYDITLTANCTITLTGGTSGQYQTVTLILRQNSTAGWLPTLPSGVRWPGGTSPTPNSTSGQIDVYKLSTSDGGATVFGSY